MTINLPREQQEWLEAQIRAGAYDSVEEAVAERMHLDIEDLSWQSRSSTRRARQLPRRGMTLEEHRSGSLSGWTHSRFDDPPVKSLNTLSFDITDSRLSFLSS